MASTRRNTRKRKSRKQKKSNRTRNFLLTLLAIAVIIGILYLFRAELAHALTPVSRPQTVCTYNERCCLPVVENDQPEQFLTRKGYSVSYNPTWRIPNWVAYELTRGELKSVVKRSNRFVTDRELERGLTHTKDYTHSGYDRGHMAPAADMGWSKQSMQESFLLSNIAPQHPDLNRKQWKNLEELIRRWAERDSVVAIACGPIVSPDDRTIGTNRITVPSRFYKVVLIPFGKPARAIGFLFDNKACDAPLNSYCVSVDSVEKVTGINFFEALPDDEEAALEAACDTGAWYWKPNQRGKVRIRK